jgi:hypothetical protein
MEPYQTRNPPRWVGGSTWAGFAGGWDPVTDPGRALVAVHIWSRTRAGENSSRESFFVVLGGRHRRAFAFAGCLLRPLFLFPF